MNEFVQARYKYDTHKTVQHAIQTCNVSILRKMWVKGLQIAKRDQHYARQRVYAKLYHLHNHPRAMTTFKWHGIESISLDKCRALLDNANARVKLYQRRLDRLNDIYPM